ncbi:ABC transporter ATP-binding protein [Peribacillus sp. NJ4]|uniref:ABC transporter ATP-binding protein n=1 Tax=Peribacillus TaxID=2675229 RepID=UPI0025A19DCD|nr:MULTISPECIES: ABC transporter ATP-binding protein [unclassified Peribacillus]MDM5210011.1 ABC transporter ATP-binding protein [Peribacillus sp. NJ4]MDM5220284.1 ABC transporter ATP-binding protein [Peribacillus sp. NJ11]
MANPIIKINNMSKSYELGGETVKALQDVCLTIDKGDFISIIGPSGSGKSTFMNMIGCLDKPDIGEYLLDGKEVEKMKDNELAAIRNIKIGFIFQNFNLLAKLTALENVELPLVYRGASLKERREVANACLDMVGLSDRKNHLPTQLSGGQQQRVAVARALAGNPPVLLADEPTGALDSKTSKEVLQMLKELNEKGQTIILITHDLEVAKEATRVVRIQDGQLFENGGDWIEPERINEDGYTQYQNQ